MMNCESSEGGKEVEGLVGVGCSMRVEFIGDDCEKRDGGDRGQLLSGLNGVCIAFAR